MDNAVFEQCQKQSLAEFDFRDILQVVSVGESLRGTTQRGFSLVEVALSIAILSILLLALFAMFTQGMYVLSHSKEVDLATERAHDCMETVRALGVGSIAFA
ncbi:MAG TPA: prepilin-type N-terminal cleavage/methylation domain-containing protein, partial [Phycisphaerales bacterium]|nr:prepilin-type N-terminal cleavage/methylation domain-containing protein [Phycisphaerales bacterium]